MNQYLFIMCRAEGQRSGKNVLCDQHQFNTTSFPRFPYYKVHRMRIVFPIPGKKAYNMCHL